MFRARLILTGFLGVLLLCAAVPAYASATGIVWISNGEILGEGVKLSVESQKAAGSGNAKLSGTLAGIEVLIECGEEHGGGTIENSATLGMGVSIVENHYLKCHVAKPAGQGCLVLNELMLIAGAHGLLLLHGEGAREELSPITPPTLTTVTLDGCSNSSLNNKFKVNGTAAGEVDNATSSVEFSSTSGSNLTFGGNPATYVDDVQTLMVGGGELVIGLGILKIIKENPVNIPAGKAREAFFEFVGAGKSGKLTTVISGKFAKRGGTCETLAEGLGNKDTCTVEIECTGAAGEEGFVTLSATFAWPAQGRLKCT